MIMLGYLPLTGSETIDTRPPAALVETFKALRSESSVLLEPEMSWARFVDGLQAPRGEFSRSHVARVKAVWAELREQLGSTLPLPLTQPTDRGSLQMTWDAGRHIVEVDVRPDGQLEWFYRDRSTNELDGTDDEPAPIIDQRLINRLALALP